MPFLKSTHLFPIAAALNFFSITALLVIAGMTGKGEMAADIGVLQGAIVAIFLSLSGNARSIALSSATDGDERAIFGFRMMFMIPAVLATYALTKGIIEVSGFLFVGLVARKCSEWVAELHLANREKDNDFLFATRYIFLNAVSLVVLSTMLAISWMEAFYLFLLVWAFVPLVFSIPYIRQAFSHNLLRIDFRPLLPHIGSSTIFGITTYVFRLMIVYLVGKAMAGQLFSAYAIGGLVSSLYMHAFGPSILLRNSTGDLRRIIAFVLLWVAAGAAVIVVVISMRVTCCSLTLLYGIGFSLVGGGVMLLAQRQRLYILQVSRKDVFVTDAMANIILITSVPLAYFVFGKEVLVGLFLWSALLNGFFYLSVIYKERINNG